MALFIELSWRSQGRTEKNHFISKHLAICRDCNWTFESQVFYRLDNPRCKTSTLTLVYVTTLYQLYKLHRVRYERVCELLMRRM
jgi:hypothetical protein